MWVTSHFHECRSSDVPVKSFETNMPHQIRPYSAGTCPWSAVPCAVVGEAVLEHAPRWLASSATVALSS